MSDLTALWKSRVGAILGIVRAGGTEHREVANMAAQVGADYHGRFVIELLQNASDQAASANLHESCVTIVRTGDFVALANEGIPFDKDKLGDITSLGLSRKNPQDAIGNKGLGFKSVFQVSESPEIYSAASSTESFADAPGLMFKLSLAPFSSQGVEDAIRNMVVEQLRDTDPGAQLTVDRAMSEITAAAPFKFPIPLSTGELNRRLADFPERPTGQTMVVLPLRKTPEALATVDHAVDELLRDAGAAILFLPSVSTIRVLDQVRGFSRTIRRELASSRRQIEGVGHVSTVVTTVQQEDKTAKRSWRLIERRIGTADVVPPEQAASEAEAINREARKLPGTNWDTVQSSPVGVAMPLPMQPAAGASFLLGTRGRICIGLPTKDSTGTPAWVNAHFFGTISRTGIDFDDNAYNALLFAEAVRLHRALIDDLKADEDVDIRRTATLAFERGTGPLATALHATGGQAKGEVVLSIDGTTFQSPRDTVLPEPADVDALLLMVRQASDLKGFGLRLPEVGLTRNARPLIESLLDAKPDAAKVAALLLDRGRGTLSVIEKAAHDRRGDGPEFWEKFLSWAVRRFTLEQLSDQRLLPVGGQAIAKPSERVFLPPYPRRAAEGLVDEDGEISEMPSELAESLKFLDDTAVAVRKPGVRSLTDIASMLAPDTGKGLVRSPRLDHLINDAVGPLMQELREDDGSKQSGIRLLRQAIQWLWALSETGRDRLTRDALRVPVRGTSETWKWVPPSTTYFGQGWFGDPTDLLLNECYGEESSRLVLPWEEFCLDFKAPSDDRDAWIGALELLGVSRSPKLIRPRGPRPAPLVIRGNSELTIDNATCPIAKAEPFWRSYLEFARRRTARTSSGQRFDFRSVVWVDGLEREKCRPAILKLMLLYPQTYEPEAKTFLERQYRQNDDATAVPSLWVHAIRNNSWKVIPTQRGAASVADAWLLDAQQRGLARRRLALLNQVEAPYDAAEQLLHEIGVTTLPTAAPDRLMHAIGRLGDSCVGYDAETRRTALALAQDLFSHFQAAYSKSPTPLGNLKAFLFPMERKGEAVRVRGDQILTAYINDDPVRAGFVPGLADAFLWPIDIRQAYRQLVSELQRQLGESAVVFTGAAPVETRFTEDRAHKHEILLEWLSVRFPQHSVACDLACLIAYTGRETDPNGEDFRRTWASFEKASIVFGAFPDDSPTPYFYDRQTGVIQVAVALSGAEVVGATWMLVGQSYHHTWSAYARELERDNPAKFLADCRITSAQRENVENAIGLSSTERFRHIKAATLALWLARFPTQPATLFNEEWDVNARSAQGICDWLGRPDLIDSFAATLGASEEEASRAIIDAGGLRSEHWQEARLALGMERWPFSHKVRAWRAAVTELVAILKTCAARAARVSLPELQSILQDPRLSTPPEMVAYTSEGEGQVLQAAFDLVESVLNESPNVTAVELLLRRLATLVDQADVTLASVDLDDAPARDVRVYRDDEEAKRSRDAQARFDGVMIVASALAKHLGESLAAEDVRSDQRVGVLVDGWWANSFTVLPAMQRVLQTRVPNSAQRMSDERVFRDPAPANELMQRFKELSDLDRGEPVAPPKRKVTVFGQEKTEDDVVNDLLHGTAGDIGQMLKEKAALQPLDPDLGTGVRGKVVLKPKTREGGGGGGGGGGTDNAKDRELVGLLGEAFVYEKFRLALPGFDEMSWRSRNRSAYGLEGEGNDALGYDFLYRDIENRLGGRADRPLCCIEVKASSGDGSESFPMTANEWDKARECHQTDESVYIIVRVANVRDDPQIADVIIDPFGLYGDGQVAVVSRDIWVYVGGPQSGGDEAAGVGPAA